jgi:hypothetical protein
MAYSELHLLQIACRKIISRSASSEQHLREFVLLCSAADMHINSKHMLSCEAKRSQSYISDQSHISDQFRMEDFNQTLGDHYRPLYDRVQSLQKIVIKNSTEKNLYGMCSFWLPIDH